MRRAVTPARMAEFFGSLFDATQLPPDNTFNKFTGTANYRDLPWNSVIAARYTWAKTTSNVNIPATQLNSFPTVAASNDRISRDSMSRPPPSSRASSQVPG